MGKFQKIDLIAVVAAFLLTVIGLTVLFTISSGTTLGGNFFRQLIAVVIGVAVMLFLISYDYRSLSAASTKLYFLMLISLLLVVVFGSTVRGTTGWLKLGIFNFQPVEVAKVVMIIFLASFLTKKKFEMSIAVRIISSIVLVALPVFLILRQPDLGSSLIIMAIWLAMLLASEIKKKNWVVLFSLGALLILSSLFFLKNYQIERLTNFIDPFSDPKGSGYNVIQSMVAVGSGGVWGKGLGHGSQSQLNFLPEKHTDFIFAVVSEELGLVGSLLVLFLFLLLFYRMKETARASRDNFGYLLVIGIMAMFFTQFLVNIGMNLGIAPVTGVPLPFLSYGGSSVLAVFAAMGIFLSVASRKTKTLD